MKTVEILIAGRVQKVGFRSCIRRMAINLGIVGEVENLPDGRVRIVARADAAILEKFTSMLYGCPRAVVRDVEILPHPDADFSQFSVQRTRPQDEIRNGVP
ncbi:MAG: acylphosphatase [Methanomicrobiales archaeon]|nr:acylphosphatase [Methanomicrobiales archaeon]MDI6876744.1 acylphosphatase [Methanomicrobiales archaeon]